MTWINLGIPGAAAADASANSTWRYVHYSSFYYYLFVYFPFCLRRSTVPGPGSRKPICRGFVVRKLKNICYGQKYIASPLPSRLSKFEHL